MHTQPMSESQGTFNELKTSKIPCGVCGFGIVKYRIWESSCGGYEDIKLECLDCKRTWWIEGSDS